MFSRNWRWISALALLSQSASAKVFLKLDEALSLAYPAQKNCQTQAENKYLTPAQMKAAADAAGSTLSGALVVRYVGLCGGKTAGHAYTETHRVRTHLETLLINVGTDGAVERVELLSFDEPLDYIPRSVWYEQFKEKKLTPELQVKRAIPFVTGASLTTKATTEAVRRVLALDRVLR